MKRLEPKTLTRAEREARKAFAAQEAEKALSEYEKAQRAFHATLRKGDRPACPQWHHTSDREVPDHSAQQHGDAFKDSSVAGKPPSKLALVHVIEGAGGAMGCVFLNAQISAIGREAEVILLDPSLSGWDPKRTFPYR